MHGLRQRYGRMATRTPGSILNVAILFLRLVRTPLSELPKKGPLIFGRPHILQSSSHGRRGPSHADRHGSLNPRSGCSRFCKLPIYRPKYNISYVIPKWYMNYIVPLKGHLILEDKIANIMLRENLRYMKLKW